MKPEWETPSIDKKFQLVTIELIAYESIRHTIKRSGRDVS